MNKQSEYSKSIIETGQTVRIGLIGTGKRGLKLLSYLLVIEGVEIVAVCDEVKIEAEKAAKLCTDSGRKKPSVYGGKKNSYLEILDKKNLDAVIIATYWNSHTAIALQAMKNRIYPGIDVPAALTVEDAWQMVETSEETEIPCMMLENWSFRKDNLALLNMKRLGMFGEIVHCHCAHSHNCIDHWFFDSKTGEPKWQAEYLVRYNRDQYPTHAVGPVISWMDINRGDIFTEIFTVTSAPKGINAYFARKFGNDHPNAKMKFRQGDIVTSVLRTKSGKTIVINNDLLLPRPYSNRWMLQGTKGIYYEEKSAIYLVDFSPEYQKWEPWQPYEEKYNHRWYQTDFSSLAVRGADFVMLARFIEAVRIKGPLPLDVYDSAVMSAIVELSEISVRENRPVPFPDFTKGNWKTREPYFAI